MLKLTAVFVLLLLKTVESLDGEEKDYIVYMGGKGETESRVLTASHNDILTSVLGSEEKASDSIIYSYKHSFNGFSARLTKEHAEIISRMPNVVSVFPSKTIQLHTTRSWDFLGVAPQQNEMGFSELAGSYDVIVGVVDTGLWPESKSFDDTGLGPVPSRWKGLCNNTGITNTSELFTCTKKIVGGRAYPLSSSSSASNSRSLLGISTGSPIVQEFNNSRDGTGHGTHTSSTATGVSVSGASLFGLAEGTARGGYSKARVAMYKACWNGGFCSENSIMAAFDDAVHDGVDVLSVSLGGRPKQYDLDGIAIAAFHAVAKGVVVSCSAGNSGPDPKSVANAAPWILTVGASSIDRKIESAILLGNNVTLPGTGLNIFDPKSSYSLVSAGNIATNGSSKFYASRCVAGYVDAAKVKGNIVYCIFDPDVGFSLAAVPNATGVILSGDFYAEILFAFTIPTTLVHESVGKQIESYISSTKNPTATILKSTTLSNVTPAPVVASFSSRGPNAVSPDIVKPDVTAPGLNILAAWPDNSPIFVLNNISYFSSYNIESGTSMSCPHVSGAAALLKSVHPDWSPAAIRSALMTTATILDNTNSPISDFNKSTSGPFDTGAGEINPAKALDPGLVYDITPQDYISYLCESGYNTTQVRLISSDPNTSCKPPKSNATTPFLNYPSIGFMGLTTTSPQSTERIVTNVGAPKSVYTAEITAPSSTSIVVEPSSLEFSSTGQKLSYTITATAKNSLPVSMWSFGSITWIASSHTVRSPIAVTSATKKIISL
ncbi:CO(2)-response secreted protease isoform X1 [Selaginella moellendorffii]|nr:CO(2)-response secreted protease isoform X1 [Selaginella moellendorffii]|eukprot:XP_024543761.1 CO(2)-response secreted protease isoform X1 [Selaginella moellendorffii]